MCPPFYLKKGEEMNRIRNEYDGKYYDSLELAHILSLFILGLGLILSSNFTNEIYPAYGLRSYAIVISVGMVIVLIYFNLCINKNNEYSLFNNIVYIFILLLVTIVTVFLSQSDSKLYSLALVLPVLFAASSLGLRGGIITSIACILIQILHHTMIYPKFLVVTLIENNLVFIGVILITGWYIGNTVELEKLSRNALEDNIQSLHRLACAVEQSPSLIVMTDANGIIEYVNKKFCINTGYDIIDVKAKPLYIINPLCTQEIKDILKEKVEWKGEIQSLRKDGEYICEMVSIIPIFNNGLVTNFLRVSEDITQNKKMEKELARIDRLHVVGEIAAGIGHEIRNPMTTVRGFLQLMSLKEKYLEEKEFFDLMIDELDRANSIITEFLNMAKGKPVEKKSLNLNDIISSLEPLLRSDAINEGKELSLELALIPGILLDQSEIRQLILNLVRNGYEAMDPKGRLTIKTYVEENEIILLIHDEGKGIDPAIIDKLGTPFLTTKDNGTGLGLSVCYSIANRHNATFDMETGSEGTTFFVRFKRPE